MTGTECKIEVLDLFSAAAGGWSLGMHRAGFQTIAACEFVDWRRALYQQNNPGVRIYDDVRTLTADQLVRDLGRLPSVIVGSPPCQDISPANTKGKGVEGARSGLYFEAVRIIGEVRPRWFALENSSNLRTRGADAVLAALEALGYSCWPFVVRAGDIGANHERPRCWIIGCDLDQVADADGIGRDEGWSRRRCGIDLSISENSGTASEDRCRPWIQRRRASPASGAEQSACGDALDAASVGHEGRRSWRHGPDGNGSASTADSFAGNAPHADQADGCMVSGVRQEEISHHGRGFGWSHDGSIAGQMGVCQTDRGNAAGESSNWSLDDFADHLQLDDGLSSWVAGSRVAVGGPKGTSAASLIVEAFGDAVVPQIPEAIGKAILRTERALAVAYGRVAA